jgi:CDP-diacylglycerol--glycerol-3-phosphate 3-phosphatidyltransferase
VLTEFCGVLVRALGGERAYDGPMGKSDRALVVGALAAVTFVWPAAYVLWPGVLLLATLLTAVTCWKRASRAVA